MRNEKEIIENFISDFYSKLKEYLKLGDKYCSTIHLGEPVEGEDGFWNFGITLPSSDDFTKDVIYVRGKLKRENEKYIILIIPRNKEFEINENKDLLNVFNEIQIIVDIQSNKIKEILKRLKMGIQPSPHQLKTSRKSLKEILEQMKAKGLVTFEYYNNKDKNNPLFNGDPTNVRITESGELYFKTFLK